MKYNKKGFAQNNGDSVSWIVTEVQMKQIFITNMAKY